MKEKLYIVSLDDHYEHKVYAVVESEKDAEKLSEYINSYYNFIKPRRKKILGIDSVFSWETPTDEEIEDYYNFIEKSEKEWFLDKGLEPASEVWTGCGFYAVNYLEEIKW